MIKGFSLNRNQLKLIAILTMLIDHIAFIIIEGGIGTAGDWAAIDRVMRGIGRIAFPIFAFTIVEGFQKTGNVRKYLSRLLIFAIISEIPFDLAVGSVWFSMEHQNVFWTLTFGLVMLMFYENYRIPIWQRSAGIFLCVMAPEFFHSDYSFFGVLTIFVMYYFRKQPFYACLAGYSVLLMMSTFEWSAIFGFCLLLLYNGEKGRDHRYFYYVFYPTHLLVLTFLQPYLVDFFKEQFITRRIF